MSALLFHQLVGYWKVDCFVNVVEPFDRTYSQKKDVPDVLKNKIHRGETVCLTRMEEDPTVLHARYCQAGKQKGHELGDFFVVCTKNTREVHIRGRGELSYQGSYKLVTILNGCSNSRNIVWKSCRRNEINHAIRWRRIDNVTNYVKTKTPALPKTLLNRTKRGTKFTQCQCNDASCIGTLIVEHSQVLTIKKPQRPTDKLKKRHKKRYQRAVTLYKARLAAHWNAIPDKASDKTQLIIGTHHMHPFAQEEWQKSQSKFKTFTIAQSEVACNVNAADVQRYFHLINIDNKPQYVPKLNYPPPKTKRKRNNNLRSTPSPKENRKRNIHQSSTSDKSLKMSTPLSKKKRKRNIGPQSTPSLNKQEKEKCKPKLSRDSPAYNAFENSAADISRLKQQIRDLQKEVDILKVKQQKIGNQMRQFFTK